MDFFRECDIFGQSISFNVMGKSKHKSLIGSIFTLILTAGTILCIIAFGQDFFNKTNPSVLSTTIAPEVYGPAYQLNYSNVQFPFRIKDVFYGNSFNFSGLLEPLPFFNQFERVNGTMKRVNQVFVQTTPCTEEMLPIEARKLVKTPSDYFCFDFKKDNISLGGSLSEDYYHTLQINMRCAKQKFTAVNVPPEECDYEGLDGRISALQRSGAFAYIEILYPEYYISEDLNEPLKVEYKPYSHELTLTSQKNEAFWLQTVEFDDDQNWIATSSVSFSKIGLSKIVTAQTIMNKDMIVKDKWSIFIFRFLLEKNYNRYQRRFMKISNLAAQVGGVISSIRTFMNMTYLLFFSYIHKEALMDNVFSYSQQSDNKNESGFKFNEFKEYV